VLVASAYHAGLSNVKLWVLRNSQDGVSLTPDEIPMDDTKDYVKKVMNAYALYYENYVVNP
jgi:soluble lytic murein transglycosylase-like protein